MHSSKLHVVLPWHLGMLIRYTLTPRKLTRTTATQTCDPGAFDPICSKHSGWNMFQVVLLGSSYVSSVWHA